MKRYSELALLLALASVVACSAKPDPASLYMERYASIESQPIQISDRDFIRASGATWVFDAPIEAAWDATLRVIHQYEGLLALERSGAGHSGVLIRGHEVRLQAASAFGGQTSGMQYSRFLESWLAFDLAPGPAPETSILSVAWISPKTGRVEVLTETEDLIAMPQAGFAGIPSGEALEAAMRRAFAGLGPKLAEAQTIEARQPLVPYTAINEVFYQIEIQLHGPKRWEAKFGTVAPAKPYRAGVETILDGEPVDYSDYADFELATGNWASARLRRSNVEVTAPGVIGVLQTMGERLTEAAGLDARRARLYVIASPEINAFALPNGDIFVCSGMLDRLAGPDQLASVLAHELDHVVHHDTLARLISARNTRDFVTGFTVVASLAGVGVGAALAPAASYGAKAVVSASARASAELTAKAAETGIRVAAGALSQTIGTAVVSGYSKGVELRADRNAAIYVWAAGYDTKAQLSMLESLRKAKVQAVARDEIISSGFINASPGLDARIENATEVLRELPGNVRVEN